MDDYHGGTCYGCRKDTNVRHKNLYPDGSEGCELCIDCEMTLVELLRNMSRKAHVRKKKEFKAKKKINLNTIGHSCCGF